MMARELLIKFQMSPQPSDGAAEQGLPEGLRHRASPLTLPSLRDGPLPLPAYAGRGQIGSEFPLPRPVFGERVGVRGGSEPDHPPGHGSARALFQSGLKASTVAPLGRSQLKIRLCHQVAW